MSIFYTIRTMNGRRFVAVNHNYHHSDHDSGSRPLKIVRKMDEAEKFDTVQQAHEFAAKHRIREYEVASYHFARGGIA